MSPLRIISILLFSICAYPQQPIQALAARLAVAPDDQSVEVLLNGEPVTEDLFQACRNPAQANLDHRQFAAALRSFSAALVVARRLSNHTDTAMAYRGIGLAYRGMSQTTLALSNYELGYESAVAAGDKGLMAALLRGSAVAKRNLGRIDDAIADDEHSVALYRALNDPREAAAALANLAVNYLKTGDLRRAAQILEEARQMGQAWPEIVDPIINNLGRTAAQQGNLSAARGYLEQSVASAGERHSTGTMLVALANLAVVYRGMGQLAKAENTFDHALTLAREIHDPNVEAITLLNRAEIYESRKRPDLAIADLKKSLEVVDRMDTPLVAAYILVPLVRLRNACAQNGTPPELQRALSIGRQFQAHNILWPALQVMGECAIARNDFAQAREAFTKSVEEVELLRDLAGGDDLTASPFLGDKTQPYHSLLDVALRQHQPEFALETAERAKARQLLDTVRRGNSKPPTILNPEELAGEQRLGDVLTQLDRRLATLPFGAQRTSVQAEWTRAQMQLAAYRERLYSVHPGVAAQRSGAAPLRLAEIGELLPDHRTALVEFTAAEKALYIFSITRGADGKPALTTRKIAWNRTDLAREVSRFREQLASRSLDYRAAAAALYTKLLAPVASDLQGKDTLVLVPDGPLWELPFQALVRPDGAHLIERATIFYTPSLTYLRENRLAHRESRAPRRLLAFGNPGSAGLPNAGREVRSLAALYDSQETRILTGPDATKQEWLQGASDYQVLHLATHGVLNSANPMYSWLSLAPAAPGSPDDALEAREVIGMHLRADVAVLSACDTARGEESSGEGMVGFSWAFLMAGVSTTVVSQWSVDSASTTQLMLAFHSQLQKALDTGSGRALALRRGALAVMRSPEHRHPYYWAGFIMVGDGY